VVLESCAAIVAASLMLIVLALPLGLTVPPPLLAAADEVID
jgi:hypothetical protein